MECPEDATEALADELRPDMLGAWLPAALADILRTLAGERAPTFEEVMRRWGLDGLANAAREAQTDGALEMLAALGKRKD